MSHRSVTLTREEVLEIRRLHATGSIGCRRLARQFRVSSGLILLILRRERWGWL